MSVIKVGRYAVNLSNEDKILFPAAGITKGQLIEYYVRIAPYMLPHVHNRPISMQRFPEGIDHEGFYHKDAPEYFPPYVARFPIARSDGEVVHYVLVNNAATLAYLANFACITMHTWLSRVDNLTCPDRMIFDLDPSGANFDVVRNVALSLKVELASHNLSSYVMTTGSRGLHVILPILPAHSFELVRKFAHQIALTMVRKYPNLCTLEIHKEKRGGKVFIDTLRNAFGQTGVAPYAVRALAQASIACPISWREVEEARLRPDTYTIKNIFMRLEQYGDMWHDINIHKNSLKIT